MNDRKVYVVQSPRNIDLSGLYKHGKPVFLLEDEYPREPSLKRDRDKITNSMMEKMQDYRAGYDMICLVPIPMACVLLGRELGFIPGEHHILKWNNNRKDYDNVILDIEAY